MYIVFLPAYLCYEINIELAKIYVVNEGNTLFWILLLVRHDDFGEHQKERSNISNLFLRVEDCPNGVYNAMLVVESQSLWCVATMVLGYISDHAAVHLITVTKRLARFEKSMLVSRMW